MAIEFTEIGGSRRVSVEMIPTKLHSGGQGRVCRASVNGNDSYCVKELPDVHRPADVHRQLAIFANLARYLDSRIRLLDSGDAIRRSLETLRAYTPTHATYDALDRSGPKCLLLLRRYSDGGSLQSLTATPRPPAQARFEIARRLVRLLTTLELNGFVHLDVYPDNVLVKIENGFVREVTLIDLEGAGLLNRDAEARYGSHVDTWVTEPSAFGKPNLWLLPAWYPRPDAGAVSAPFSGNYRSAARWQAICIALFALTWGGVPFAWLVPSAFQRVAASRTRVTSPADREALSMVDQRRYAGFINCLDGKETILSTFRQWIERGFLNPRALPPIQSVQQFLNSAAR